MDALSVATKVRMRGHTKKKRHGLLCKHVLKMICQRPPPILIKLVKQIHVAAGIGKDAVKNGTAALGARGKEYLQDE